MRQDVMISGIRKAILAAGRVSINTTPEEQPLGLDLAVGAATAPFTLENGEAQTPAGPGRQQIDASDLGALFVSDTPETGPEDTHASWVNRHADWALSGHQTLQLMLIAPERPLSLSLRRPWRIAPAQAPTALRLLLAQHRARAVLEVTISAPGGAPLAQHRIPFDTTCRGGRVRSGYQPVEIPLPDHHDGLELDLRLTYQGYCCDGSGTEPFLFLADPRISAEADDRQLILPREVTLNAEAGSVWLSAPLPAMPGPGRPIELRLGGTRMTLFDVDDPSIRLTEECGHSLVVAAAHPTEAILCLDGSPETRLLIDPAGTPVRLPGHLLDGQRHRIGILDASGSVPLLACDHLAPVSLTPLDVLQREAPPPYPETLVPQTPARYRGMRAHLSETDTNHAQIARALTALEAGPARVSLDPLHFDRPETPTVSVVIPAHDKVHLTYLTLCSLLVAHNTTSFEVIVVDDSSSDATAQLESLVTGITVLHTAVPQRFVRACNAGAEMARGTYIALLNNDVEVTAGWLDALVAAFTRFDNVGLAGSKLLNMDGTLQDAGGIVWNSGNPWNYGRGQNPADPRFSYARQADYLSGAAMMTTRALWDQLGGLSDEFAPMYFEDTDFAFKVRAAGYTTWYVPGSEVFHFEGGTSGTDTGAGFKRYQEVNRPKFKRRWARAFAGFGKEGTAPDLEKDRGITGRVLVADYTTPRPDQDAGSFAAVQEIRLIQSLGYKVTFLPLNLAHMGHYTTRLQDMGVEVIHAPFTLSPEDFLSARGAEFDACYLTRFYVAETLLESLRTHAPQARILFNNADLHFLREMRAARSADDPDRLEEARATRDRELAIIGAVDVVLSYNSAEHSVIEACTDGQAVIRHCPWVQDVPGTAAARDGRAGLSFLGSFRHHPNAEGLHWFARDVMPRVASEIGAVPLAIYGAGMGEDIQALESTLIHPKGYVETLSDAFDPHRIFVAPLLSGAGIKGKVLAALAHGIPCVLSPVAAEGIGLRHGHDCLIAETPDDWLSAVDQLNSDDRLWQSMADHARAYVVERFSFDRGIRMMRDAFESADLFSARAA